MNAWEGVEGPSASFLPTHLLPSPLPLPPLSLLRVLPTVPETASPPLPFLPYLSFSRSDYVCMCE